MTTATRTFKFKLADGTSVDLECQPELLRLAQERFGGETLDDDKMRAFLTEVLKSASRDE